MIKLQHSDNNCRHNHDLVLEAVSAHYDGHLALKDTSFSLSCGHRLAILGPNGAGKSTLIRILAGLKTKSSGNITWQGKPLLKQSREIAYLPQIDQHQHEFPITAREVVAMGRYPHVGFWKKFTKVDHEKVETALEIMEITSLAEQQIDELSGGQQQRAFIARALAQEAHVILLDEPFNGLDTESQIHLAATLKQLSQTGHLILCSHHNLNTVESIFDYTLVLDKSQVAFGKTSEILHRDDVQSLFTCHHHLAHDHA